MIAELFRRLVREGRSIRPEALANALYLAPWLNRRTDVDVVDDGRELTESDNQGAGATAGMPTIGSVPKASTPPPIPDLAGRVAQAGLRQAPNAQAASAAVHGDPDLAVRIPERPGVGPRAGCVP